MNPFQTLGVPPDADELTIKRAYRRLAMRFHPDHNPGAPQAEARFKAISAAYDMLRARPPVASAARTGGTRQSAVDEFRRTRAAQAARFYADMQRQMHENGACDGKPPQFG